jgi:signal transduction histidine kinase
MSIAMGLIMSDEILEAVDRLRPVAEQAGVELRVAEAAPCVAACGAGVLTSLVSNLVLNAIKYMGDRPVRRVEVRVLDGGSAVRVEVEDTGSGVAPALAERIFLPYVRGPASGVEGLGLGLATVQRLADGHGGNAGVRSSPGEGSVFWFELPKPGAATSRGRAPRRVG